LEQVAWNASTGLEVVRGCEMGKLSHGLIERGDHQAKATAAILWQWIYCGRNEEPMQLQVPLHTWGDAPQKSRKE